MAVAFDADDNLEFSDVNSVSWTHTPVGTPTGVGIGVGFVNNSGNAVEISACTYGGTAAPREHLQQTSLAGVVAQAELRGLVNPASGAQTVEVTFSVTRNFGNGGSITVTGGDTSDLVSAGNTAGTGAADSDPSGGVTVNSATGELVMDVIAVHLNATLTVAEGQTQRWNGGPGTDSAASTKAGAATVNMAWTATGAERWIQAAMSFKAAAGGGGATIPIFRQHYENMARR